VLRYFKHARRKVGQVIFDNLEGAWPSKTRIFISYINFAARDTFEATTVVVTIKKVQRCGEKSGLENGKFS
jgi:hypothetical protein